MVIRTMLETEEKTPAREASGNLLPQISKKPLCTAKWLAVRPATKLIQGFVV